MVDARLLISFDRLVQLAIVDHELIDPELDMGSGAEAEAETVIVYVKEE